MKTIEDFESGKAVGVSNYLNSLSYFTKLTGHKSQVKIGGAIGYGDSIKLNHDLVEWNKWYDLNKCHMTKAKVDSVLGDYKFQDD
nr:hypothetical protein [Allomuricauda sp.]